MYEAEVKYGKKFLTRASQEQLKTALREGNDESEDIFDFCASEQVEYLNLNDCSLTAVPESISRITSLIALRLSRNRLTALPSSFNQLQHLELLYIDGNSIETFPTVICQMTGLKMLNLSGNKLKSIPESIGNLVNLEQLWLSNNSISKLSVSLHKLNNLKLLSLNSNPLVFPPPSAIEGDFSQKARKVVAYLKSYHDYRQIVIQMLSLQRCRDRQNYIFNEFDDEDWPQSEEERREKRERREREEQEEEDDSSSTD